MLQNERGITLVSLVLIIIVVMILSGATIYSGMSTIKNTNKTSFISELEIIQAKVNTIYEKRNTNTSDMNFYDAIGQPLSVVEQEKLNNALNGISQEGFKFFNKTDLEKLGLSNIKQDVLINFNTREVVSLTGIEIDGIKYYKLRDIPGYQGFNIGYVNKNSAEPTFTLEKIKNNNGTYNITLKDIVYNSNVNSGTVSYKLHNDTDWIMNGNNMSFTVTSSGTYDVKLTDRAGNSTIKSITIEISIENTIDNTLGNTVQNNDI